MPTGDVVLTEQLNLKVRISKAALSIQNKATIEVAGLSTELRTQLLTQFTAWNKRLVSDIVIRNAPYINVTIQAGYRVQTVDRSRDQVIDSLSTVFVGQVVLCEPVNPPPDIVVKISCFTRQVDKTMFITKIPPTKMRFYDFVAWAANEMGFGSNFRCETSYNDREITNPSGSFFTRASLLINIQDMYRPDVAAFIDDEVLIVKDRDKIIRANSVPKLYDFVHIPSWNEWGIEVTTLFDANIRLAGAIEVFSVMNPSMIGQYVVTSIDYDLTSRDTPFYVKATASPPA